MEYPKHFSHQNAPTMRRSVSAGGDHYLGGGHSSHPQDFFQHAQPEMSRHYSANPYELEASHPGHAHHNTSSGGGGGTRQHHQYIHPSLLSRGGGAATTPIMELPPDLDANFNFPGEPIPPPARQQRVQQVDRRSYYNHQREQGYADQQYGLSGYERSSHTNTTGGGGGGGAGASYMSGGQRPPPPLPQPTHYGGYHGADTGADGGGAPPMITEEPMLKKPHFNMPRSRTVPVTETVPMHPMQQGPPNMRGGGMGAGHYGHSGGGGGGHMDNKGGGNSGQYMSQSLRPPHHTQPQMVNAGVGVGVGGGGVVPTMVPPKASGYMKDSREIQIPASAANDVVANTKLMSGLVQELRTLCEVNEKSKARLRELSLKLAEEKKATDEVYKTMEEKREEWKNEREKIIRAHGGRLPAKIAEQDNMRKSVEKMKTKNSALQASLEVIQTHLQNELSALQKQLKDEREIAEQTEEHNIELERRVKELQDEKKQLEDELAAEKEKETIGEPEAPESGMSAVYSEYPPESTVIQNLLQAQVEFYFSDYNLKRDKRLLQDVVKEPTKGFLPLDQVMQLSRIRQLCGEKDQLIEALKRSKILTLKEDMVGRESFIKPTEKEFPFRRTVFIFGIPKEADDDFLIAMLKPFGVITKVQFDHGPDTLDRRIGQRFMSKPRVYALFTPGDEHIEMSFVTRHSHEAINMLMCNKCNKPKQISEGFYVTTHFETNYCAQCAAQIAEDQLNQFYQRKFDKSKNYYLGEPPKDITNRKTALVVFQSQRQASKCAYVRTRIAFQGAFATHYHHYSKVKKESVSVLSSQQQRPSMTANDAVNMQRLNNHPMNQPNNSGMRRVYGSVNNNRNPNHNQMRGNLGRMNMRGKPQFNMPAMGNRRIPNWSGGMGGKSSDSPFLSTLEEEPMRHQPNLMAGVGAMSIDTGIMGFKNAKNKRKLATVSENRNLFASEDSKDESESKTDKESIHDDENNDDINDSNANGANATDATTNDAPSAPPKIPRQHSAPTLL